MKCCKFGTFRDNFIFANSVKTHICDVENSRQGRDLPLSVNDRVISPIREDIFSRNFTQAKFRENKTLAIISEFTVSKNISRGYTCLSGHFYFFYPDVAQTSKLARKMPNVSSELLADIVYV